MDRIGRVNLKIFNQSIIGKSENFQTIANSSTSKNSGLVENLDYNKIGSSLNDLKKLNSLPNSILS